MGERRYTYSASGNPLTIEGGDVNRTLTWDAENRLRRISDSRSGQLHLYTYNHLGERALKRYGKAQTMAVNDKDAGALLDTKDNYSAYVSPYFVRHNNRYTKHYYAGAMRIASKMGASGSTYAAGTDEPDLYFYFTDHLGSTTYITDRKEVAQYVAYTPYGETFKEYKNVTPYKFNGKELDQETGYYYYGARYYDPQTALWFGTDPLAHINPQVSPYVYCKSNPVCRIDLDGRADWQAVYDGSLSVVGGALSCIAGGTAACTPTGVGQVAGAVLISTGIVGMGLGTTQIIAGFVDVPNASNIPTGCVEAIGMVSDAVFNLDKCQTVGGYVDMGVGISATKAAGQSLNIVDILSITSSVVYDYSNIVTFTKSNVGDNNQFICDPDKVRVQQPLIRETIHQDEK